jgi:nucleoid-associated protein YgaU
MTTEATVYDDTPSNEISVGVIERIGRTLDAAGLEVAPMLYEEALELARSGLLGAARDRLRMLLCLDPESGDARLLLAKVFVGQQRWADALSQLDAARTLGLQVPASLQAKVEAGLEAERNASELNAQRAATREQAELKALRAEARRLRTENTRLARDRKQLRGRANLWSASTAGLAGLSLVLLTFLWLGSPADEPDELALSDQPIATVASLDNQPVDLEEAAAAVETVPQVVAEYETVQEEIAQILEEEPVQTATDGPRTHVVVSGDSLYELAKFYYGDGTKWKAIKDANPGKVKRRNGLSLGTELVIP